MPVVEEELHVGKRKVSKGGVKVKTKVTETPVEEQIHLHEEEVKVHRRPAKSAATAADAAFQEGTLELTETAEEAVVAKKAKVVEEVVVKKEGHDRTHTVKDKVRPTSTSSRPTPTPTTPTSAPTTRSTSPGPAGAYEDYTSPTASATTWRATTATRATDRGRA